MNTPSQNPTENLPLAHIDQATNKRLRPNNRLGRIVAGGAVASGILLGIAANTGSDGADRAETPVIAEAPAADTTPSTEPELIPPAHPEEGPDEVLPPIIEPAHPQEGPDEVLPPTESPTTTVTEAPAQAPPAPEELPRTL